MVAPVFKQSGLKCLPCEVIRLTSAVILIFTLSTVTVSAETYFAAPGPNGSDANDCLSPSQPCATFRHAVDLCPRSCAILAAPGVYSQKTNVYYYKTISIGPLNQGGTCTDRSAIAVDDRIDGVGQAYPIFFVQDHAILIISCMTVTSYAKGWVGFASRQFAIGDVVDVDFGQFRGGHGVVANETSKVNIARPGIYGDASGFAAAGDLSQVVIGDSISVGRGLTFEVAFLRAVSHSVATVYASKIVGGEALSGASYQCKDSIITANVTLPGGDVPYAGTENCVFNATYINPQIKAIRSEVDTNLKPEIKAIRSEIDTDLKPEIKAMYKLLRNTIIAALALLTVFGLVSAFYVWLQRRRRML